MWCIITEDRTYSLNNKNSIMYLAWQNPVYDEDGYFWTYEDTFKEVLYNSTSEHPFLFETKMDGIRHLKSINIPQKCMVVKLEDCLQLGTTDIEMLYLNNKK